MDICEHIKNITKAPKDVDFTTASTVNEDQIRTMKTICKSSELATKDASRYLLLDLTSKSSLVRLRSLCVIDSLFLRSKVFRKEISSNIRLIAECAGYLGGKSIENNEQRVLLQSRIKMLLEMWDSLYGEFLPEIRALTRYMREFLHLDMPNIQVYESY